MLSTMRIALDATVVRPPLTGVHYAVKNEVAALLAGAGPAWLCLATDPYLRQAARDAGQAAPELTPALRRVWRRVLWQQNALPGLLRREGCDALAALSYTAPRRCPVPCLLQVHDTIALRRPELCSRLNAWHMRTLMPGSIRRAAAVIVSADSVRREVMELLGKPPAQIHVAPLGVDPIFLGEPPAPLPESLTDEPPFLLAVGTLEPKKGLDVLLDAYARVAATHPLPLVLAGRIGWKSEALAARIRAWSGPGRVIHLGYVDRDRLPALYRAAAALVMASTEEGFGLPVLEAMACGLPVLLTPGCNFPEVVAAGAGLVVERDIAALTAGLRELLPDMDRCAQMGRTARRMIEDHYTWAQVAAQMADVYQHARDRKGQTRS